jgi:hypothetical protein
MGNLRTLACGDLSHAHLRQDYNKQLGKTFVKSSYGFVFEHLRTLAMRVV